MIRIKTRRMLVSRWSPTPGPGCRKAPNSGASLRPGRRERRCPTHRVETDCDESSRARLASDGHGLLRGGQISSLSRARGGGTPTGFCDTEQDSQSPGDAGVPQTLRGTVRMRLGDGSWENADLQADPRNPLRGSGDQARAPLGTPGIDHPSSILCGAASAEPMGPSPLQAAGLEGAFHDRYSGNRRPGLGIETRRKKHGKVSNFTTKVNAETPGATVAGCG